MKPMLARTYGPRYDSFPCYVQPKLNGVRALYQSGFFQSRDEKLWKPNVLRHLIADLRQIDLGPLILDGELYVHGWKLQRINGAIAVNRNEPSDDTPKVEYHVFDVVNPQDNFSDRWLTLRHGLLESPLEHVKVVSTDFVHDRAELDLYFHRYTSLGYEGVMLRPNGPYEFGETPHGTQKRSEFLWKYKMWEDDEFLCCGVTQGEGKADIGIGALELSAIKGQFFPKFKVGTGFSDEERVYYMLHPPIGRLVRVRYLCLTSDGIPFNPSFIAVMS